MKRSWMTHVGLLLLILLLAASQVFAASANITGVKVADGATAFKLIVSADSVVKYRTMRMNEPRVALVLEVFSAKLTSQIPKVIEVNRGLVEKVRIAQFSEHPDIVRMVVDLISPAEFNVVTSPEKGMLTLVINTVNIAAAKSAAPVAKATPKKVEKPMVSPAPAEIVAKKAQPKLLATPSPTPSIDIVAKSTRVEKPKPVAAKPKPVAEKPKPVVVVVEEEVVKPVVIVVEEPKPAAAKPKPVVIEKPKPLAVKPKPVVQKPKPLVVKPKPVVQKPKPVALKTTEVAKKEKAKPKVVIERKLKTISLDFVNADLLYVIKLLAKEIGVNMVTDQTVKGEVTIAVKDVTPEVALNLILNMSGFKFMRVNDTIIVGSQETLSRIPKDIMAKKEVEKTVTQKIYLEYADPNALVKDLSSEFPSASIKPMVGIRGIIVTAPLSQVLEIKQTAAQVDVSEKAVSEKVGKPSLEKPKEVTEFIQLKFSKVKDIMENLKAVKLVPNANILADESLSLLIIKASEDDVRTVKDYVAKIEHSRLRQLVRLDVKVVDLSEDGSKRLGMNWSGAGGSMGAFDPVRWTEVRKGQTPDNALTAKTTDIGVGYFIRDPMVLVSTLNMLVSNGDARIVASPTVTTLSAKEATVKVGETYPYVMQDPRSGQYQLQNIEYLTRMTITPTVTSEEYALTDPDKVLLDVDVDVSDKKGTETTLGIPVRGTKSVKTTLIVRSGETLVIGGLMSVQETSSTAKIPLLGDIPIIGKMFQNTRIDKNNREVIIMITPTIIKEGAVE